MRALSIKGLTTDDDVRWLAEAASRHRTIIEIGPHRGRSTRALADATSGHVYAIDNWNGAAGDTHVRRACLYNLRDLIGTKVTLIEQDSALGVPEALAGVRADMLWIDGDHRYESVKADIQLYAPLVRRGGLICGHDYCVWHPEVVRAVDEAFGRRVRSIDIHRSIWWVTA